MPVQVMQRLDEAAAASKPPRTQYLPEMTRVESFEAADPVVALSAGYVFWLALTASGKVYACDTGFDGYAGLLPASEAHGGWQAVNSVLFRSPDVLLQLLGPPRLLVLTDCMDCISVQSATAVSTSWYPSERTSPAVAHHLPDFRVESSGARTCQTARRPSRLGLSAACLQLCQWQREESPRLL